jgi:hypothetical protein
MATLDARLSHLEATLLAPADTTIVVRFDAPPGQAKQQIQQLRALGDGREWSRLPGEAEAAFIDRANAEAARGAGVAVLMADTAPRR